MVEVCFRFRNPPFEKISLALHGYHIHKIEIFRGFALQRLCKYWNMILNWKQDETAFWWLEQWFHFYGIIWAAMIYNDGTRLRSDKSNVADELGLVSKGENHVHEPLLWQTQTTRRAQLKRPNRCNVSKPLNTHTCTQQSSPFPLHHHHRRPQEWKLYPSLDLPLPHRVLVRRYVTVVSPETLTYFFTDRCSPRCLLIRVSG